MKKIGIYGGSFDPVHKGHRLLAENLSKKINADKVFIIPAAIYLSSLSNHLTYVSHFLTPG
jgi:cytidyltransferase-like protein